MQPSMRVVAMHFTLSRVNFVCNLSLYYNFM